MKLIKQVILILIVALLFSCSSKNQKFKIDQSISSTIDSISKANVAFDGLGKPGFLFHLRKTFDYEKFGRTDNDWAYFLNPNSHKSKEVYFEAGTQCYLDKDTIKLLGVLFRENNIAIQISIFENEFNSQFRLNAAKSVYSKTETKSDLLTDILLNSDHVTLTLTESPEFKIGSSLKGKMEVKFEPFYQVDSSNSVLKIAPEFDIIFDTKVGFRR